MSKSNNRKADAGKAHSKAKDAKGKDVKSKRSKNHATGDAPRMTLGPVSSDAYPYDERLKRKVYEAEKRALQIELLKVQHWLRDSGERLAIVFEGRDAAGKGGTIKRFMEYLNPRFARIVALDKPNETEKGQWYFQRYVSRFPTSGEIVLFDRSWYNRAGVEAVMGFATPEEVERFLVQVPQQERLWVEDGLHLVKLYFSVSREEQSIRFAKRAADPLTHWKLSPMDAVAQKKWDEYTNAAEAMFARTHSDHAPWTLIRSDDKRRARIGALRHVLSQLDYPGKDKKMIGTPDPLIVVDADRLILPDD